MILAVVGLVLADWWRTVPEDLQATYVGRQRCADCHQTETQQWIGSHHDLAMDRATPETVLGDFNDAELTQFGVTSKMFRLDGKYLVQTDGPDGQLAEFEVRYVFGVEPLQQYMVEFDRPADARPHEVARLQVLRLCWDTGGKRWFYLPPPDVRDEPLRSDDPLHWTGITMCWNSNCADCHSTNLQPGFDPATRTYRTTFSEIDVSCEACHGPGSLHVQLASRWSLFWDRRRGKGLVPLKDGSAEREIHTCAHCHARRTHVVDPSYAGGANFYDHFNHAALTAPLYHADGQIRDEVYELGSFLQSKMYAQGVRCTDCHDPHSLQLKHTGNQVCTSCHQHPAGKYDGQRHHHHPDDSAGAQCVACHMPATTYMEVDPRRDHSFRVPRPDLSTRIGTPNACSQCHLRETSPLSKVPSRSHPGEHGPSEHGPSQGLSVRAPERPEHLRDADYATWIQLAEEGDVAAKAYLSYLDRWSSQWCAEWYGARPESDAHFASAFHLARRGEPAAEQQLLHLAGDKKTPAIVRATALTELAQFESRAARSTFLDALADANPQVRQAAIDSLWSTASLDELALADHLGPLLIDPTRLVRTEAARVLARVPVRELRGSERAAVTTATAEYERGLLTQNDRAAGHAALGLLRESQGRTRDAIAAYEMAIHVEPNFSGPRTNLARLLEGEEPPSALQPSPRPRPTGAGQVSDRDQQRIAELRAEELELARRNAELAPQLAGVQHRYGLALYLAGRLDEANVALERACELEPRNPQYLLALVRLDQEQGRFERARQGARRLVGLRPQNAGYAQLLAEIENP